MAALTPDDLSALCRRFAQVRGQVADACRRAGRDPGSVTLLGVSKLQPAEVVAAALQLDQLDFGENYAQELRDKDQALGTLLPADGKRPRWHFIGPLQRNKVRLVAGRVSLIHTVDSVALLQKLAQDGAAQGVPQECLVEVNVASEAQKAGCSPEDLPALLHAFAAAGGGARCVGLMCIPPQSADPEQTRPHFRRLRQVLEEAVRTPRPHVALRELSMGMSHDFPVAIEEGATLVRVGTALFGQRPAR